VQALLDFLERCRASLTRIQRGKFIPEFQHGRLGADDAKGFLGALILSRRCAYGTFHSLGHVDLLLVCPN
jgi:hypothetical protein